MASCLELTEMVLAAQQLAILQDRVFLLGGVVFSGEISVKNLPETQAKSLNEA